jgi:ribose/xylose/arabinose/galactoside ABC-type transport system permease subunit
MAVSPVPAGRPLPFRAAGLIAHLAWEAVLLLAVIMLAGVLAADGALDGSGQPWGVIAQIGFPATAFALSLRTATPNLAVVGLAALSGVVFVTLVNDGQPAALAGLLAVLAATVIGGLMGAFAGLTSAPAWAVSLGGLAVAVAAAYAFTETAQPVALRSDGLRATGVTVFAVLILLASIGGGLLWLVPRLGDLLGGWRHTDDPVAFRPARLTAALVGLAGSSLIAGVGGVITASYVHVAVPGAEITRMLPVLGAVLLGGVSVYGRRGGIAGTALAVTLIALASIALRRYDAPASADYALSAGAILLGLLVGRALEQLAGRTPGPSGPTGPNSSPAQAQASPYRA